MRVYDVDVKVKKTQGDEFVFDFGSVEYTVSQGILSDLLEQGPDLLQTFLSNLTIRLSLSGIDPTDEAAVIAELSKVKFKLPK